MGKRWVNVELRQTLWNVESELRQLQDIEAQAPELMDEQRKGRRDELIKQLPKLRIQYGLCGGDGGIPDEGQAATEMRGWELLYIPDTPEEEKAIHGALSREPAPATPATQAPANDAGPEAIDPQAAAVDAKGVTITEALQEVKNQMGKRCPKVAEMKRWFDGISSGRKGNEIGSAPGRGGKPPALYPLPWLTGYVIGVLADHGYYLSDDERKEMAQALKATARPPEKRPPIEPAPVAMV